MRRCLLALAVVVGAVVAGARPAAAACDLTGPFLGTGAQLPLGCPLWVYHEIVSPEPIAARATVLRDGQYVDVTGVREIRDLSLDTRFQFLCDGELISSSLTQQRYGEYRLEVVGVEVGERIGFNTGWISGIEVVPAAPCAPPRLPELLCIDTLPSCGFPDELLGETNGCGAGGAGGGVAVLVVVAVAIGLVARRRRSCCR